MAQALFPPPPVPLCLSTGPALEETTVSLGKALRSPAIMKTSFVKMWWSKLAVIILLQCGPFLTAAFCGKSWHLRETLTLSKQVMLTISEGRIQN